MQYIYDEQGATFNYFLITVLAIFLIPTTFSLLFKSNKDEKINKPECFCNVCKSREAWLKLQRSKSRINRINKTAIAVVIGWIMFTYLAYKVATVKVEIEVWDPYNILGIDESMPVVGIKKHFKELSRIWHPDKAPSDKKAEYEEKFIDYSKAYKVLTDDDIRKNYEDWGHPDGKQAYSLGIALPTWLVEAKNSPFVLGVYGIIFGFFLPFFVGRWWYGSRNYTKDRIRTHTMELYFKELRDKSTTRQILDLLSASNEYIELVEYRPADDTLLPPIIQTIKEELDRRFGEKYEKSKRYNAPYCQKASALLYAHMLRVEIHDHDLMKDKYFIVEKAVHLINGMLDIALAHHWLQTSLRCMELSQLLVQAMWIRENPLVQLPFITNEVLKTMKVKRKNIRNIGQLRDLGEEGMKNAIRLSNDSEYTTLAHIAKLYPIIKVEEAYFKVTGDEVITPGSIVTLLIKIKIANSSKKVDTISETDDTDKKLQKESMQDDDEKGDYLDSEDELLFGGMKPVSEEKSAFVHAPYLTRDKKPYLWIFMADDKKDRVIIEPTKVTDIVTTKTFKFKFQAPPEPGLYSFVAYIKSDSYVGTDIRKDLRLDVKDFSALPPEEEIVDDISEPEEDSIEGQMRLMREQGFAAAVTGGGGKKPKENDSSDSDDD